jgi:PAS domain S-box-containing protein
MLPTDIRDALTTAMMHSAAPMVLCDPHVPDFPMIAVNQAFCDLSGYPEHIMLGQNCRFLQGPRTDAVSTSRIRASLNAGLGCIEWIVNYRQDGEMFYNLLFISPVRGRDGALLYYFGNQLDITMGAPAWLTEVSFGTAHVVPDLEQEFHALMEDVTVAARTQALERIVAAAHRLAEISTKLAPGTLETVKPRRA